MLRNILMGMLMAWALISCNSEVIQKIPCTITLIDSGVINEGNFVYKKPKLKHTACRTTTDNYLFLSGDNTLLQGRKDSTGMITITSNYSIPDSIWLKAQNVYYNAIPDTISQEWIDSMNRTNETIKANKSIIYSMSYNAEKNQIQLLCDFSCAESVVKTIGKDRYEMVSIFRPLFLLTLDSAMQVQQLSLFSTPEIKATDAGMASMFGCYYSDDDTLIVPELVRTGSKQKTYPLYGSYGVQGGIFRKVHTSALEYNVKDNIASEGFIQRFGPSFMKWQHSLLMADYRNVYNLSSSQILYSLPSAYFPGGKIMEMAASDTSMVLLMVEVKAEGISDSLLYFTNIDRSNNRAERVRNLMTYKQLYSLIPGGQQLSIIYGSGEKIRYATYEVH